MAVFREACIVPWMIFGLSRVWAKPTSRSLVGRSLFLCSYPCPCLNNLPISSGITVPIHPLDLTMPGVYNLTDGTTATFCINAFRSLTIDALPFDFLLGDAFLRNTYAVYDFGDF